MACPNRAWLRLMLMINEKELQISNKSYINKDFASIYPELIDLAKNITRRWDPQTSNESDPGIVLLKLLAFVGDKLNYNVDKNVLECFMPSCTQESSMRKLCDMLGYEMGYYEAPEVTVTFSYSGDSLNGATLRFPALGTSICDDAESVYYVLVEDVNVSTLEGNNEPQTGKALEGTANTLNVGDSEVIGLENLDDNNRLYFPVSGVAQNGVFIENSTSDGESSSAFWERVSNLNVQPSRSRVFKFGYDSSKGLPYIEFPDDISSLIGDGLIVRYVVTDGLSGAVSAGMLNRIASPTQISIGDKTVQIVTDPDEASDDSPVNLVVNNPSASTSGADPETIDEAYNSFKKTVGTFDTLVTCRDYANAIYSMKNPDDGSNYVSNVQVSDRRDDINRSMRVVTLGLNGQETVNANLENPALKKSGLDANTLCLYLFRPYSSNTESGFVDSFRSQGTSPSREIVENLEDSKTASHDYLGYGNEASVDRANDIAAIKNYMRLVARITTTYKVNDAERADIVRNVKKALIRDYNMRQVDWGYEIPFDSLMETITSADKRISSVSLAEPELSTKVAFVDPTLPEADFISYGSSASVNPYVVVVAKNVLAGRIPLFGYDESFYFDFGQATENSPVSSGLESMSSAFVREGGFKAKAEYVLKANEVLQFIRPSISDVLTYTAYVYYSWKGSKVPANSDHQIVEGESLVVQYTDSNQKLVTKAYGKGEIIKPNFDLVDNSANGKFEITVDGLSYKADQTDAQQSITTRKINRVVLESTPYYCYWIVNNADNALFFQSDLDPSTRTLRRVLGDNEFFFYTDASFRSMVTFGSGTTIETTITDVSKWVADSININEALNGGLLALKDKWVYFNFRTSPGSITATENQILTLVEGDSFTPAKNIVIEPNDFSGVDVVGSSYVSAGEEGTFDGITLSSEGYGWQARTRLDIDFGPSEPQALLENHWICVTPMKGIGSNPSPGTPVIYSRDSSQALPSELSERWQGAVRKEAGYLSCNYLMQVSGAWAINLKSAIPSMSETDVGADAGESAYYAKFDYPVSVYGYSRSDGETAYLERDSRGFATLSFEGTSSGPQTIKYDYPNIGKASIFGVYWLPSAGEGQGAVATIEGTGGAVSFYNADGNPSQGLKQGLNNIAVPAGTTAISFKVNAKGDIIVSEPRFYDGYNSALGLSAFGNESNNVASALLNELKGVSEYTDGTGNKKTMFFYSNEPSNADSLDVSDVSSPYAFYEYNNVANKFTISEIDFESSEIDVVRSSRL